MPEFLIVQRYLAERQILSDKNQNADESSRSNVYADRFAEHSLSTLGLFVKGPGNTVA